MDLEELRAFISVADTGSLLAAAAALRTSRTTLRRRVEALEARVGAALVVRTRRGIVPTGAGEVLLRRGRAMVQEANALLEAVANMRDYVAGVVRLALPVGMPPHAMGPWFAALRRKHPELSIDLRLVHEPADLVLDEVDVAIHWGRVAPGAPWLTRDVAPIRQWLIASRRYLQRRGKPTAITDLDSHTLLAWIPPGGDAQSLPGPRGARIAIEPAFASTDIHLLRQCAIHGMGIAFVPDAMLPDPGVAAREIVGVLPDLVKCQHVLRCSVPRVLADVPKIQAVVQHAQLLAAKRAGRAGREESGRDAS
jgi:DNA-binding transcriptional LysR family regulator